MGQETARSKMRPGCLLESRSIAHRASTCPAPPRPPAAVMRTSLGVLRQLGGAAPSACRRRRAAAVYFRRADPLGLRTHLACPRQRDQPGARAVGAGVPRVLPWVRDRVDSARPTTGNAKAPGQRAPPRLRSTSPWGGFRPSACSSCCCSPPCCCWDLRARENERSRAEVEWDRIPELLGEIARLLAEVWARLTIHSDDSLAG